MKQPANFNLPTGCSMSDLPGNHRGPDTPYCEVPDCYAVLETEQEIRTSCCAKHLQEALEGVGE